MLALCGHLPQLAAVRFDMWCISESGVGSIIGAIGARLRVLCVQGETITGNYIGDGTLIALTTVCPNLERFTYVLGASYWNAGADGLSAEEFAFVTRGCNRTAAPFASTPGADTAHALFDLAAEISPNATALCTAGVA